MNALYTQKHTIYTLYMELKRLSDVATEAGKNVSRYVKLFREAVVNEEFDAAELAERFKISASRDAQDFAIIYNEAFKRWHAAAILKAQTRGDLPTFAEIKKEPKKLKAHIEATRKRMRDTRERSARSNAKRDAQKKDEGTQSE